MGLTIAEGAKLEFDAAEGSEAAKRGVKKRGSTQERSSMNSNRRLGQLHDPKTMERLRAMDRVEELVAEGRSRLTAQRMVEIERGEAGAGRARRHPLSR